MSVFPPPADRRCDDFQPASTSGWPVSSVHRAVASGLRCVATTLLLGMLVLGLAAPDEAHAQTCNVTNARTQAASAFDYHRDDTGGNLPTATAAYRVLIALGGTLPAWNGKQTFLANAPTTAISEVDLRTFLTGRNDNWAGWNPVYTALNCLEARPAVTISGGQAVTEGAVAQFTVNVNPAPGSALTVKPNRRGRRQQRLRALERRGRPDDRYPSQPHLGAPHRLHSERQKR